MHRATLLAFLLATLNFSYCAFKGSVVINTVYATSDPTLIDQEEENENDIEGSGCSEDCGWVRHHSSGTTYTARAEDLEELEYFLRQSEINLDSDELVASAAALQMEDGPSLVDLDKETPLKELVPRVEPHGQSLDEIPSSNYYPEYAIGALDNGCTAFLISPFHALTTAHCVYDHNTDTWNEELRFSRGRNEDSYLEKMEWANVIVPYEFYLTGAPEHNWALITYHKTSPVWIRIAHSPLISDVTFTLYGYLNEKKWGGLYCTVCRSDLHQVSPECIAMQCGTDQKISGGPVMRGYNFQRSKMPLAYGISVNEDYSYAHNVVRFNSRLFWSLCYFMKTGGFDPRCKLQ